MREIAFHTKIFIGDNALDRLNSICDKKILLVTDPFIEQSGLLKEATDRLENRGNEFIIFSHIVPDPPIEIVAEGINLMSEFMPSVILAIGGGSAIDAAKAMKDFSKKIIPQQSDITFIAIPTTSGAGSEVTSFSVITDQAKQVKYPLVADSLLPDEAILDANLIKSVPKTVTADTGMDVLTHAIEAYVSTEANDFSDAFAEKAVQLIFEFLPRAYKDGSDLEAREKVHHASTLAGLAFNMVGLGINHSMAHVCGAQFHIPHGRINAILLPAVMEFNAGSDSSITSKKYAKLARILGISSSNSKVGFIQLTQQIYQLKKELSIPANLRACGVKLEQLAASKQLVSEAALADGCTLTNPRTPTAKDIETILEKIY